VTAADVTAAVDSAREHNLRLLVRGGGHSYLGTSNSRDSLLIWTRRMAGIELHDAFVPAGTNAAPLPAVTVGPGAVWGHVYNAVTTKGARLVQGGSCPTVSVAGLVLGGRGACLAGNRHAPCQNNARSGKSRMDCSYAVASS